MRALILLAALSSRPDAVASFESPTHGYHVCGSLLEAFGWERAGTCNRRLLKDFVWRAA